MRKVSKIAAAAAGIVLAGGAAAAAVTTPPEAADTGISTAEDHTGIELPATNDDHPSRDDHPDGTDEADAATTEGVGPVDNHGADVSAVAQDDSTVGRDHGEAVSATASDGHGAPSTAASQAPVVTPNGGGTGTASDASGGASDVAASHTGPQAAAGSANADSHKP
jgi:hypothetical protein